MYPMTILKVIDFGILCFEYFRGTNPDFHQLGCTNAMRYWALLQCRPHSRRQDDFVVNCKCFCAGFRNFVLQNLIGL